MGQNYDLLLYQVVYKSERNAYCNRIPYCEVGNETLDLLQNYSTVLRRERHKILIRKREKVLFENTRRNYTILKRIPEKQ
jgi:hypothetical protein